MRAGEVLAEKAGGEKSTHSDQLLSDVNEILKKNNLDLKQVNLLAVAVGPGSFTGLRIGLSTVKGLGRALKIPIAGIPTLAAAAACFSKGGEVSAVLPAGRSEYFLQSFYKCSEKGLKPVSEIDIYTEKKIKEKVTASENSNWISTAEITGIISAEKQNLNLNVQILPANLAISVGQIAFEAYLNGNLKDYQPFPVYARGADTGGNKNAK